MPTTSRRWKGKERALEPDMRDTSEEGSGGAGGVVLPLDMVGSGVYDVAYTIPVKFSENSQQFSLQVDTGSSDLWVASTSCSTSSCGLTQGRLYDPSSSTATGADFSIPYLQGSAGGPIVWDRVSLGGYTIDNQALAAANSVQSEPLSPKFSGILGLALPLNSIIAEDIPPVTNNNPDGAAWASNLFSITPSTLAPASRFLSLALSRPGSNQVPAVLGIGRHPAALVPDPSKVKYSTLVSDRAGSLYWKASVRAITVYVGGVAKVVEVGRSNTGAVFPSAVLDSGVPLILTTSAIANAIYGAIGVSPGSDGMYYVPCTTPLNMTITIDTRPEIPLHPLDLTAEPPTDNTAQFCIGLIQPADAQLSKPDSTIGDMILGVPFLRNVYTVMAYTPPNTDGSFTAVDPGNSTDGGASQTIRPRLGLMSLTDPTTALKEFNTVRVLNQPISSGGGGTASGGSTGSDSNTKTVDVGGKKLSVGIVVLVGILGFFALCGALFAVRWFVYRRRFRRAAANNGSDDGSGMMGMGLDQKAAYRLARRTSSTALGISDVLSEDELRDMRYKAFLRKEKKSDSTLDSDKTHVQSAGGKEYVDEFGYVKPAGLGEEEEVWDPRTGVPGLWGDRTLVGAGTYPKQNEQEHHIAAAVPLVSDRDRPSPPSSPDDPSFPPHHRQYSDPEPAASAVVGGAPHKQTLSVDEPLLPMHQRARSEEYDHDNHPPTHTSSPFQPYPQQNQQGSTYNQEDPQRRYTLDDTLEDAQDEQDDLGELGFANGVTMAGVGTASRTSKIGAGRDPAAFRESNRIDSSFGRESFMSMSSAGTNVGVGGRDGGGRSFSPVNAGVVGYGRSLRSPVQGRTDIPQRQKWTLTDPGSGVGAPS